jgi:integrase
MSVKSRPDSPYYWAAAKNPVTGKVERWSTKEKTRAGAERAYRAKLVEWEREAVDGEGLRSVTLAKALGQYIDSLGTRPAARGFAQMATKTLGTSPSPAMAGRFKLDGSTLLHKLQTRDLELLRRARVTEGNAPQTIAHEIKIIRAATIYAGKMMACRVPKEITWPMPKLTTKTRVLSREEYLKIYAYLDPERPVSFLGRGGKPARAYVQKGSLFRQRQDVRDIFVALLMTGGRWTEVAKLSWSDLMDGGTILLNSYKTDDTRVVPMPAPVREMLERRYAARDPKQPYIFPGRWGGPRAERSSCRPILRAMNALGFNSPDNVAKHGRCVVHSLRHTFATWLSQSGEDIKALQTVLGHKNIKMTERYVHLDAVSTAERLGKRLEGMALTSEGKADPVKE